jgi:hypothetical protein
MPRSLVLALVAVTTFAVAAPAFAEPAARVRPSLHYRTLEKMLRRFSRQAGGPARGPIYAAR